MSTDPSLLSLMSIGDTVNEIEVKEIKETHVVLKAECLKHKGPIIPPSREDNESEDDWSSVYTKEMSCLGRSCVMTKTWMRGTRTGWHHCCTPGGF